MASLEGRERPDAVEWDAISFFVPWERKMDKELLF